MEDIEELELKREIAKISEIAEDDDRAIIFVTLCSLSLSTAMLIVWLGGYSKNPSSVGYGKLTFATASRIGPFHVSSGLPCAMTGIPICS